MTGVRNRCSPNSSAICWRSSRIAYGTGSLIITSQLPIDRWYEIVGNPTLADAILDRIIHNAHRIELRGESLRKPRASG